MRESPSYRTRWWAAARRGAGTRLRWPWGPATAIGVLLLSAAFTLWVDARDGLVDADSAVTAFVGALGGVSLWFLLVVTYSAIRAPTEIAAEDAESIRMLHEQIASQAAPTILDVIRLFDKHIESGRPMARTLAAMKRAKPPPDEAEWVAASYAARDWMNESLALVTNHCISRKQAFGPIWRSVPSVVRYQRTDDDIAAALARRGTAEKWIRDGSAVLLGCIELKEKQLGG